MPDKPSRLREYVSMTRKHWLWLVFTVAFATTGAADAWANWKTPASLWFYVAFVCLCVAQYMSFCDVAKQRDELKATFGPKLVPVKCQPEVWQLIEAGANAPHDSCKAWV